MSLLINLIALLDLWRPSFSKKQLFQRVRALAIGFLGTVSRKTLTNVSIFLGCSQKGYEANCAVFSRRKWNAQELFNPILKEALAFVKGSYICVAADDTTLKKTGKKIQNASWKRDPLSPPFHINFIWGLRFLQFSLLLDPTCSLASRAIPVDFIEAPCMKKLKKQASLEEKKAYKKLKAEHSLSILFVKFVKNLKYRLVNVCQESRKLLMTCDGSFCNKICMGVEVPGVEILARCKKNAKLCFRYQGSNKRKKYSDEKFTPEEIRRNKECRWKSMEGFYGGKKRRIKYKEINHILWQGGTKTRPLKLIVLAPTPYRKKIKGRLYYKQPAYLLCTDIEGDAQELIIAYLSRWQIEVNHREEKSILGLGEAQVWNDKSIERQPSFHIAVYSILLLAARKTYEDKPQIDEEPAWRRKKPKRLTFRKIMGLIRAEIIDYPEILQQVDINPVEIAAFLKKAA